MKLLCCYCQKGKKKVADFIYMGASYCTDCYYRQHDYEQCRKNCEIKTPEEFKKHKHLEVKHLPR